MAIRSQSGRLHKRSSEVVWEGAFCGNSINPYKSIAKNVEFAKENRNSWMQTVFFGARDGQLYYRSGIGSFRLNNMQKIENLDELSDIFTRLQS